MKLHMIAALAILSTGLMAGMCEQEGSGRDPVANEKCKSTYTSKDTCEADSACEWKERSDGQFVCRAKS